MESNNQEKTFPHPLRIVSNLAFWQSPVWAGRTISICAADESPDDLPPVVQAFRLFKARPHYDVVVTMGTRASLFYGLLCFLFGRPSKQIMVEYFLDYPQPASLRWRIKTALYRLVAHRALGILTNSSPEVAATCKRFNLPEANVLFVPMYTTIRNPHREETDACFVYSVGRTLRDNQTLLAAAPLFNLPLCLVVGREDTLPEPLPENVTLRRDIPLDECHRLLREATLVVIPLLPTERSTGQVVMFEAMALGKPVVMTRVAGATDYIRDGENGLLIPPEDSAALAEAVNRLIDSPALAHELADTALKQCVDEWMPDHHARHMLGAIDRLYSLQTGNANS